MESLKASTEDQMMGCIARPGEQSYYLKNDILGIGSSRLLGASRGVSVDVHAAVGLFLLRRRPNYLYPCFNGHALTASLSQLLRTLYFKLPSPAQLSACAQFHGE